MLAKYTNVNSVQDTTPLQVARAGAAPNNGDILRELTMPKVANLEQISMPPPKAGSSVLNSSKNMGELLDSMKMPSPDMASLLVSMKSPLAPSAEQGQTQINSPASIHPTNRQEVSSSNSNAFENVASALSQISPGNLFKDLQHGISPIKQLGKNILNILTSSFTAVFNFFFKRLR